jgi:hypothetical protein
MASSLPILIQEPPTTPPQGPTRPVDDDDELLYGPPGLSPLSAKYPRKSVYTGLTGSPRAPLSPGSVLLSPYGPMVNGSESESMSMNGSENFKNPFNFQPMQYTVGSPTVPALAAVKQTVGVLSILIGTAANPSTRNWDVDEDTSTPGVAYLTRSFSHLRHVHPSSSQRLSQSPHSKSFALA